jgi:assimilatory nitrate reductase catalytic subunit
MPGYRSYDDAARELAALWSVDESRLPTGAGLPRHHQRRSRRQSWFRVIGTNPVVRSHRDVLEEAGASSCLWCRTVETPITAWRLRAPAAIWGEKDGTYTNSERRVPVRGREPPATRARLRHLPRPPTAAAATTRSRGKTPEDASRWRRNGRPCDYSAMDSERIDAAGGVQWPCRDDTAVLGGTPQLYGDARFPTPDGRARLHSVEPQPIADAPRPRYPFLLNTGRTVEHWHTRTKTGKVPILQRLAQKRGRDAPRRRGSPRRSGDEVRIGTL